MALLSYDHFSLLIDWDFQHYHFILETLRTDVYLEKIFRKILKVGSGTARRKGTQGTVNVMEVVIIISEAPIPDQSSCLRPCDTKTEVCAYLHCYT